MPWSWPLGPPYFLWGRRLAYAHYTIRIEQGTYQTLYCSCSPRATFLLRLDHIKCPGMERSGSLMVRNIHGRGAKPCHLHHGETIAIWYRSMHSNSLCEGVMDQSAIGQAVFRLAAAYQSSLRTLQRCEHFPTFHKVYFQPFMWGSWIINQHGGLQKWESGSEEWILID